MAVVTYDPGYDLRILEILQKVDAGMGYDLHLGCSTREGRHYLQVLNVQGVCSRSGNPMPWKGRKWLLSQHMTKSEIIQTAFMAVLAAVEHEAREGFTYKGQAIFGPHFDVDALVNLCEEHKLDARSEPYLKGPLTS